MVSMLSVDRLENAKNKTGLNTVGRNTCGNVFWLHIILTKFLRGWFSNIHVLVKQFRESKNIPTVYLYVVLGLRKDSDMCMFQCGL